MAGADLKVEVRGLVEFKGALKKIDRELPAALKAGFKDIAEHVAGKIRPKVPHRSGRAAGSVKGRGGAKGGAIAFGGSAAPYYPWLDFGGSTGPGHRPGAAGSGSIKRTWLGNPVGEGRYVYPTIRDERKTIIRETDEVIEKLAKRAGFDTTGRN